MPLNTNLRWLSVGVILAATVHLVVVYATPVVLTSLTLNRLLEKAPANTMFHHPEGTITMAKEELANPNMLVSTCVFDVTKKPLRVETLVPETFWSLAMYTRDRKAFFVLNESQTPVKNVTIDLVGPTSGRDYLKQDMSVPIIESPNDQGIIVMRMLASDQNKRNDLREMRTASRCALVENTRPTVVPRLKPEDDGQQTQGE